MNRKLSPLLVVTVIPLWVAVTPADAARLPIPKPPRLSIVKVVPPKPGVRVPRSDFQAPKMARPADPSKGVYKPRTLREQVLFGQALARPRIGMDLTRKMGPLNDPRWHHTKGWVKMVQDVHPDQLPIPYSEKYPHPNTPIHVHYNLNQIDGEIADVKIKGPLMPK